MILLLLFPTSILSFLLNLTSIIIKIQKIHMNQKLVICFDR